MQDVFSHFEQEKSRGICLHLLPVGHRTRDNQLMLPFFRVITGFSRFCWRNKRHIFAGFAGDKMYDYEVLGV